MMQEYRPPIDEFPDATEYFSADDEVRLFEEMNKAAAEAESKGYTVVKRRKIGRNDPCPCGSGKKFKKCCIDKVK